MLQQHDPPHYWDQNQPLSCVAEQEETAHKIDANITVSAESHLTAALICQSF